MPTRPVSPVAPVSRAAVLALPVLFFLGVGFRVFISTGRDDAHITYWPAYTLAQFGEILNYNGERVEQSSSLLHVVLIALLHKLTRVDVVTLGKLTSILAGAGTLVVLYALLRRFADRAVAFAGTMLAAACAYFVYWSFGGMETTLVCLLGVGAVLAVGDVLSRPTRGTFARALAAIALFAFVRPEAPLVMIGFTTAVLGLALAGRGEGLTLRARSRAPFALLLASLACFALVLMFRLAYFHSAFPQPVAAKAAGISPASVARGVEYVVDGIFRHGSGIAIAMCAAVAACVTLAVRELRGRRFASHATLTTVYIAGYFFFVVVSGGDWMEGARFLVFFLPAAVALVPAALASLVPGDRSRSALLAAASTALFLVEANAMIGFARAESVATLHWESLTVAKEHDLTRYSWFERSNRVNMRDVRQISALSRLIPRLESRLPGPIVIMSGQMGMVPYHVSREFFGRVRFIDRRGLCDRAVTDCDAARSIPRGPIGVELEYLDYFALRARLEEACALPRPHVIFDLRGGNSHIVSERGYSVVARQFGAIRDVTESGGEVGADEFVAVEAELWASMADTTTLDR